MAHNGFGSGKTIRRKFHHKWCIIALDQPTAEHPAHQNGQQYANDIHGYHDHRLVFGGKECTYHHDVDGQTRTAAHQRKHQYGDESASTALNGTGGHHSRYIATETHNQRDERLAVKPHLVHHLVHDESRPGHIARIFHERNEEIKQQYLWQENDDGSYTSNGSIHNHILEHTIRQQRTYQPTDSLNTRLNPIHGILTQGKCHLEHDVKHEEKERETEIFVCDQSI